MKAPKSPPLCPACHQMPWRPGHASTLIGNADLPREGEFTVCMHCSAVWRLARRDHSLAWEPPTEEERVALEPILGPVAARFAFNRAMEEFMPGWNAMNDELRAALNKRARKQ